MQTHLQKTRKLVESALMVAFSTILSVLPMAQLPYGGSVTIASMFPLVLNAYRNGLGYGFGAGLCYGVIQQLLGLKNLSYFTTWQSVVAVILLDYLLAFAMTGLGGVFRRAIPSQRGALSAGAALAALCRYLCHVISGATVWAGLSIPSSAALLYSFGYNATYMVPETVILVAVSAYLGSLLDFRKEIPDRLKTAGTAPKSGILPACAGLLAVGALGFDICALFLHLQNPDTGSFDITLLKTDSFVGSFWFPMLIVTAAAALVAAVCLLAGALLRRRQAEKSTENA